jgi:hypothetical protein
MQYQLAVFCLTENDLTREVSEATSSTYYNEPVSRSDVGVENGLTC